MGVGCGYVVPSAGLVRSQGLAVSGCGSGLICAWVLARLGSLAGSDGNSLLLNSLETRADSPPSLSQIEALRPLRRCATDATVIGIAIFGCVVWSHGTCGIQTSLCVSAEYTWPELRRFSVNTSCTCLILTRAWFGALSRVCLHAYLPICCLRFRPSGYVHLYVKCCQPITEIWTVFPPGRTQIGIRRRPESRCTCSYIRSSLDQYLSTDCHV